jgi:hypothetical protein
MKYLGLVAVAVIGCGPPHVTVHPLPPNATPQQRMAMWQQYRPTGELTETFRSCGGRGVHYGCSSSSNKGLIFADGEVVRDLTDLEQLVSPTSETAQHVHRAQSYRHRAILFELAAAAAVVGGFYVASHADQGSSDVKTGIGIMIGGLLVGGIGAAIEIHGQHAERDAAFGWYPHDLADQLHLCFNGLAVTPCESVTPSSAPPPDPNLDQLRQR